MSNTSTIAGSVVPEDSPATSAHCLITGYIRDLAGDALAGYGFTVRYIHEPIGTGATTLFLREKIFVRADTSGKVSFNLLQGAKVKIEIPGRMLDMIRICTIPSSTSANLLDILFPRVTSAAFSISTLTLASGSANSPVITGTMSDGTTLDVSSAATIASSNTGVVSVSENTLTAVANGSATITITSIDLTKLDIGKEPDGDAIVRDSLPAPTLTSEIAVTVAG